MGAVIFEKKCRLCRCASELHYDPSAELFPNGIRKPKSKKPREAKVLGELHPRNPQQTPEQRSEKHRQKVVDVQNRRNYHAGRILSHLREQ